MADLDRLRVDLRKLSVALTVRRYAGEHDIVALVADDLDLPTDLVAADILEPMGSWLAHARAGPSLSRTSTTPSRPPQGHAGWRCAALQFHRFQKTTESSYSV